MIVELVIARGTALVVDGHAPLNNWGTSGEDETNTVTCSEDANHGPVQVGSHLIRGWRSDKPLEAEWKGRPKTLTILLTVNGQPLERVLRVKTCRCASKEWCKTITMTTGRKVLLDGHNLYVRAQD